LADLKVAQLPWDLPSVPSQNQHTSSGPANIGKHQPQTVPSNGNPIPPQPSTSNPQRGSDGTRIKPEPGSYPSPVSQQNGYAVPPVPQFPPGYKMNAQQRAAMNLQQSYGPQAAQQISQLQQQASQQRPQGGPSAPYPKMEDQKPLLSSHPPFSPTASQAPNAPASSAQTDGTRDSLAEWKAEVVRRRELAAQNSGEGDRLFREHWLETQQRLEAGGLMLPLSEQQTAFKGVKRKIRNSKSSKVPSSNADPQQHVKESESSLFRAQGDAAADDDADGEVDEDAINSDLDDSDQQEDDENNEENTDQIMLCTYDKVQRVKNKWKCTLKDGIVKVGSTE
jgi:transcription initiation factor TFIIA large subunit